MKKMKRLTACLIAFKLLLIPAFVFSQKKTEIAPVRFSNQTIIKGKGEYPYYTLSQKSPTTYRIEGPGKLYLNSRVELASNTSKSKVSGIKVVQSESLVKIFEIPELPLDDVKSGENDFPSKIHRIEIDVPPGKHAYRMYTTDAKQSVYTRGFFEPHPKPVWEDLIPVNKPNKMEVRFEKSKKVLQYYEIKKKNGFQFMVKDTAQLRLVIRPSFDNKMLDDTKIVISILNKNTGQEQKYKFSSARATDVEFPNDSKSIPGKSVMFYANLPKPKSKGDIYDIQLLSGAKSVAIRVSVNKKFRK